MGMPAPSANSSSSILQPEAVDLDAGDDHRPLGWRRCGATASPTASAKRLGIAGGLLCDGRVRAVGHHADHVARQFDVARPPVADHRRQHAVDLAAGPCADRSVRPRRSRCGGTPRPACENPCTRWCSSGLLNRSRMPGRAADDHHRRFLGIGPGDRIAQAQPAHAIGDAHRPDAVEPGVGVGGEAGAVLARAADQIGSGSSPASRRTPARSRRGCRRRRARRNPGAGGSDSRRSKRPTRPVGARRRGRQLAARFATGSLFFHPFGLFAGLSRQSLGVSGTIFFGTFSP